MPDAKCQMPNAYLGNRCKTRPRRMGSTTPLAYRVIELNFQVIGLRRSSLSQCGVIRPISPFTFPSWTPVPISCACGTRTKLRTSWARSRPRSKRKFAVHMKHHALANSHARNPWSVSCLFFRGGRSALPVYTRATGDKPSEVGSLSAPMHRSSSASTCGTSQCHCLFVSFLVASYYKSPFRLSFASS